MYNQICQSNCCECAEAQQAATGAGSKNRTFTINGAITVIETVTNAENLSANEWSRAREEKDTVCVTTNQSNGALTGQECYQIVPCEVETTGGAAQVGGKILGGGVKIPKQSSGLGME